LKVFSLDRVWRRVRYRQRDRNVTAVSG